MISFLICLAFLGGVQESKYKYPLNQELRGSFGACGKNDCKMIEIKCKVVKKDDNYICTYKVKNLSKKYKIMFNWELLDVVADGFPDGIPNWWNLKPQQEIIVTLKTKEAPIMKTLPARMMEKARGDDKAWGEIFSGHGVTMPGEFRYVNSFGQPGPVPPSFLKKRE